MPEPEDLRLVLGILSSRKTARRAEAVRRTWLAQPLPPSVEAYFLVGDPGRPSRIEGDVLLLDCGDEYEDLVYKVRAFLRFVAEQRSGAMVFKCDDDTYVHLPNLLRAARRVQGGEGGGYCGNVLRLASSEMEARARGWHREKVSDPSFGQNYEGRLSVWCDGGTGYFLLPVAQRALLGIASWRPVGYVGEDVHTANLLFEAGITPRQLEGLRPVAGGAELDQIDGREISLHPVAAEAMAAVHAASIEARLQSDVA